MADINLLLSDKVYRNKVLNYIEANEGTMIGLKNINDVECSQVFYDKYIISCLSFLRANYTFKKEIITHMRFKHNSYNDDVTFVTLINVTMVIDKKVFDYNFFSFNIANCYKSTKNILTLNGRILFKQKSIC